MDAPTLSALAGSAAKLNVLYVIVGLFVIVAAFTFLGTLGERALGLDLKGFVNNVEKRAADGDVWPGVVAFIVVPAGVLSLVLWIGLR